MMIVDGIVIITAKALILMPKVVRSLMIELALFLKSVLHVFFYKKNLKFCLLIFFPFSLSLKVVSATFVLVCPSHFKHFFCSRENQILEFYIFKFHDVIKCLSIKQ